MKLKSLLLGSATALALSTGAQAADAIISVVSLDACDAFGISGLTLSTDDTCLSISGRVRYNFTWGDYADNYPVAITSQGTVSVDDDDGITDWESRVRWNLTTRAVTDTDFGQGTAVLTLEGDDRTRWENGIFIPGGFGGAEPRFTEAYVSVGDTTILTAGRVKAADSLANIGDDVPFNHLGTFLSEATDEGVLWSNGIGRGGDVIQLETEFGDGIAAGIGLERLNNATDNGTLVGVINVNQAWGSAHFTGIVNDVLNGFAASDWAIHAGTTVNFDPVRVRAAVAYDSLDYLQGLLSAEASFDMFTIAGTVEASNQDELGFGASVGADVTESIALNLGFRYFNDTFNVDTWQVEAEVVAAVAENLEATVALGAITGSAIAAGDDPIIYGLVGLEYEPGGNFVLDGGVEVNSLGAYQLSFGASKSF